MSKDKRYKMNEQSYRIRFDQPVETEMTRSGDLGDDSDDRDLYAMQSNLAVRLRNHIFRELR